MDINTKSQIRHIGSVLTSNDLCIWSLLKAKSLHTIQFVQAGICANLGLANGQEYCQENPQVAVPCYVQSNDPNLNVVVQFSYDNLGTAVQDRSTLTLTQSASSIWATTYSKSIEKTYTLSAEDLDAIYTIC